MNDTPIYMVTDEFAYDVMDNIDLTGDTCDRCRDVQRMVKASGCDINCPLYGVALTTDSNGVVR